MNMWGNQLFLHSIYRILENFPKMSQYESNFRFLQMSGTTAKWAQIIFPF